MLEKEKIIKGLKSDEILVKSFMIDYVFIKGLIDNEIEDIIIDIINNEFEIININTLIYFDLSKKLIEALIKKHEDTEDIKIKNEIDYILVRHYKIIKELENKYNFEQILCDYKDEDIMFEYNLLLYKKIKHFENKEDIFNYFEKYLDNYVMEKYSDVEKVIIDAIHIVYTLNEDKHTDATSFFTNLAPKIISSDLQVDDFHARMLEYFIISLLNYNDEMYASILFQIYKILLYNNQVDECYTYFWYYFAKIRNKELLEDFFNCFEEREISRHIKNDVICIAEVLDFNEIDDFLFDRLVNNKKIKNKEKICIIKVLALRMNKNIIPYVKEYVKKYECDYDTLDFFLSVLPILLIEEPDEDITREALEKYNKFCEEDN